MTTTIATRDDLPCVSRDSEGNQQHWFSTHSSTDCYDTTTALGAACVDAIAQLARVDEHEAYIAIKHALLSPHWNEEGGEEEGFADAIARIVIIGWRGIRTPDGEAFVKIFDPTLAHWCSLMQRVELREAQLKALNVTLWRTMDDARLAA